MTDPTAPVDGAPTDLDKLVERYIKLRDKKAEMKAAYDAQVAALDTAMEKVETYMLGMLNTMGLESFRTKFGTPYKSVKTSATVADWGVLFPWIQENAQFQFLEHRVSKTAVEEYAKATGDLPPGVNVSRVTVVNIRR